MNTSMVYCNEVGCTIHGPDLLFCLVAAAYEHHRGVSAAAITITNQIIYISVSASTGIVVNA